MAALTGTEQLSTYVALDSGDMSSNITTTVNVGGPRRKFTKNTVVTIEYENLTGTLDGSLGIYGGASESGQFDLLEAVKTASATPGIYTLFINGKFQYLQIVWTKNNCTAGDLTIRITDNSMEGN